MAPDIADLADVTISFDGITYVKGAAILKQLVAYVGLEGFLTGLREYFRAYAFGNAGFDDLLAALEKSSGRDLSDRAQGWLRTAGVNTLQADFDVDDGNETLTRIHCEEVDIDGPRIDIPTLVGISPGQPILVNDDDLTYSALRLDCDWTATGLRLDCDWTATGLRLDKDPLTVARERIGDIADPLARCLVWSGL